MSLATLGSSAMSDLERKKKKPIDHVSNWLANSYLAMISRHFGICTSQVNLISKLVQKTHLQIDLAVGRLFY